MTDAAGGEVGTGAGTVAARLAEQESVSMLAPLALAAAEGNAFTALQLPFFWVATKALLAEEDP